MMSESREVLNVALEGILAKGLDGTWGIFGGVTYKFVENSSDKFLLRRKVGDICDLVVADRNGIPTCVKLTLSSKRPAGAGQNEPLNIKRYSGVLRQLTNPYAKILLNGKSDTSLFCYSPEMRQRMTADPKLNLPQKIEFQADAVSFIQTFSLGEQIAEQDLPPLNPALGTAGTIKPVARKDGSLEGQMRTEFPKNQVIEVPAQSTETRVPEAATASGIKGNRKDAAPDEPAGNAITAPQKETPAEPNVPGKKQWDPIIRTVSISNKISLKNYESLDVRVSGECDCRDDEDLESLIAYLDHICSKFGAGSETVRDSIDSYRNRVLKGAFPE